MNEHSFTFHGEALIALGSGALFWPAQRLLCVSDLHLGKAERRARLGDAPLPPYETRDTLSRLEADLRQTKARQVICLGDSFDDTRTAEALPEEETLWITRLQAGRAWVWIEGNHDPGPIALGGTHRVEEHIGPLTFRHIAQPEADAEVSGHFHPKARMSVRGASLSKPAFLVDSRRLIMPAYGTYTGGLRSNDATLCQLMQSDARAILTGRKLIAIPMPR